MRARFKIKFVNIPTNESLKDLYQDRMLTEIYKDNLQCKRKIPTRWHSVL